MGMITVIDNKPLLDPEICTKIADFERKMKEIKAQEDVLRESIRLEMEEKGYKSIDTEEMLITYKAPTDREDFDKKAFRADHPDLYDDYIKMTPVKSSISIKLR